MATVDDLLSKLEKLLKEQEEDMDKYASDLQKCIDDKDTEFLL